jgi:hypothetical protein
MPSPSHPPALTSLQSRQDPPRPPVSRHSHWHGHWHRGIWHLRVRLGYTHGVRQADPELGRRAGRGGTGAARPRSMRGWRTGGAARSLTTTLPGRGLPRSACREHDDARKHADHAASRSPVFSGRCRPTTDADHSRLLALHDVFLASDTTVALLTDLPSTGDSNGTLPFDDAEDTVR